MAIGMTSLYATAISVCLPGNGRNAINITMAASPTPHVAPYIGA